MKKLISLLILCIWGISSGFIPPFQSIQIEAYLACFEGNTSIELRITSAGTIEVNQGILTKVNDSTYLLSQISAGQSIEIRQTTPQSTEVLDFLVPEVELEPIFPPLVSSFNICQDDLPIVLTALVATGQTADWYDAPFGGKLLAQGKLEFTATSEGTYYVEARDPNRACQSVSSERSAAKVTKLKSLCPEILVTKIVNLPK